MSWTAPGPSEYSLPRRRGFSVAVMRCCAQGGSTSEFPTFSNGAEGALVTLAFLSCHLECHVPEESPFDFLPRKLDLRKMLTAAFEAAVNFRG